MRLIEECLKEAIYEMCRDCMDWDEKSKHCKLQEYRCFVQRWIDALDIEQGKRPKFNCYDELFYEDLPKEQPKI